MGGESKQYIAQVRYRLYGGGVDKWKVVILRENFLLSGGRGGKTDEVREGRAKWGREEVVIEE